eukprot:1161551-Pelagomonas_calceolata.AAC.8
MLKAMTIARQRPPGRNEGAARCMVPYSPEPSLQCSAEPSCHRILRMVTHRTAIRQHMNKGTQTPLRASATFAGQYTTFTSQAVTPTCPAQIFQASRHACCSVQSRDTPRAWQQPRKSTYTLIPSRLVSICSKLT